MKINENDLDNMLKIRFASLDFSQPENQRMLDAVSVDVFKTSQGLRLKKLISLGAAIVLPLVVLTGLYSMFSTDTGNFVAQHPGDPEPRVQALPMTSELQEADSSNIVSTPTHTDKPVFAKRAAAIDRVNPATESRTSVSEDAVSDEANVIVTEQAPVDTSRYLFPVLTEKEKKKNKSDKQKLIRLIAKISREKTSHFPRIPSSRDGAIGEFYMSSGEVTNKQYRIFLYDLLISGRRDEFLVAKPAQSLWKGIEGQSTFDYLEKAYFTGGDHDDAPVVNVTPEGASLFCRWVVDELDSLRAKESKAPKLVVSLPTREEWIHAASGGRNGAMYPWPHDSIQNLKNMFLANCCIQKKKDQIHHPIGFGKHKLELNAFTSAGMMLRNVQVGPIMTWAYNPNDFMLYCMSGNAAEMVTYGSRIMVKGGSWADDMDQLKLQYEEEYKGPSPRIGFRWIAREAK